MLLMIAEAARFLYEPSKQFDARTKNMLGFGSRQKLITNQSMERNILGEFYSQLFTIIVGRKVLYLVIQGVLAVHSRIFCLLVRSKPQL